MANRGRQVTRAKSKTDRDIIEATGNVLRRHRKSLRLSQTALAEAMDISYQQVQKYENGASKVSLPRFFQTARVLGVDPQELLREVMEESGYAHPTPVRPPKPGKRDPLRRVEKDLRNIADLIAKITSGS